jgi:hypothetical protein
VKEIIVGVLILGVMVAPSFFVSADSDQTPVADEILGSTSPFDGDTDDDGLSDTRELNSKTSATNPDTDGDGLNDGVEIKKYGSDALSVHTDEDGINDSVEVNKYSTDPASVDTDGDGINDPVEIRRGTDPTSEQNCDVSGKEVHSDDDKLDDFTECRLGTNPSSSDTDGDGLKDHEEINGVTDGGVEIPKSNPTHMDLYIRIVATDDYQYNNETIKEFFAQTEIDNPNGTDGVNVHIDVVSASETPTADSFSEYRKMGRQYEDKYGTSDGVYSLVVMGDIQIMNVGGKGEVPGDYALVEPGKDHLIIHEVLHNVLGNIDNTQCENDKTHICSEEGIMNKQIGREDFKLSQATLQHIEENGFERKE